MTHTSSCTQKGISHHPTCVGPPGSFSPSAYFQVAVSKNTTPVFLNATTIPYDLVLANAGGGVFDIIHHWYVVALGGPYHFNYTITLNDTGFGGTPNGTVVVYAIVGSLKAPQETVQQLSLLASFSNIQAETKLLSGSSVIELLPLQTISFSSVNVSGNSSSNIVGPTIVSTPPYPTLFSGYSLF